MTTNETLTRIEEMEKELKELREEVLKKGEKKVVARGRAQEYDTYYYIDGYGDILKNKELLSKYEESRFALGNYYLTIAEAELALEQQKVTQLLRDIALELNDCREIDWSSRSIYYIRLDYNNERLEKVCSLGVKGTHIYCLSKDFLIIAIERIGKDRLVNYFENYR